MLTRYSIWVHAKFDRIFQFEENRNWWSFFQEKAYCAAVQKTSYFDKLKQVRKNFSTPTWRAKTLFHLNNDLDVITPMWTGWKAVAYDMIICTYECTSLRSLTFNLSCQSLFSDEQPSECSVRSVPEGETHMPKILDQDGSTFKVYLYTTFLQ